MTRGRADRSRAWGRADAGLRVPVGELRRHTAERRRWQVTVHLDGLRVADTAIGPTTDVAIDVELESVPDGVVVHGDIASRWTAACNRCLEPVAGTITTSVREVFERVPTEGESYPLGTEELDLEPMVRDALLLDLPLVAHCERPDGEPCTDLVGAAGDEDPDDGPAHRATPGDPRWAALDQITFDE